MKNLLLAFFLLPLAAVSQVKLPLIAEGSASSLYITHTAGPKENMYSIGRIYNISPRVVAPFNNFELETPIKIGQVIKIPLTEINFSRDGAIATGEVLIPVYHKVMAGETLNAISSAANVDAETLKQWNNLRSSSLTRGSNLVIGYLKVNSELSPIASSAVNVIPLATKNEAKVPALEPQKEVVKSEPVKETPQSKPILTQEQVDNERNFNGGFFRNSYSSTGKTEAGLAGTFKSTSGWEDGKYYCLHNTAQAGTIVKITNSANGKIVYAKVLDIIPDIKQNDGMLVRLSNAAANELGVDSENFQCTINY